MVIYVKNLCRRLNKIIELMINKKNADLQNSEGQHFFCYLAYIITFWLLM